MGLAEHVDTMFSRTELYFVYLLVSVGSHGIHTLPSNSWQHFSTGGVPVEYHQGGSFDCCLDLLHVHAVPHKILALVVCVLISPNRQLRLLLGSFTFSCCTTQSPSAGGVCIDITKATASTTVGFFYILMLYHTGTQFPPPLHFIQRIRCWFQHPETSTANDSCSYLWLNG